jgi:hypothetical protein
MKPLARKSDIFVENLPEEVVLYDKTNNKVHCLNKTAAAIWENCDGTRTVDDLVHVLESKFGTSADSNLVLQALEELKKANLMKAGTVAVPDAALTSRREAMGKMALAGSALVATIIAAPPSAHASGPRPMPPRRRRRR